jgi:hypothetical protein
VCSGSESVSACCFIPPTVPAGLAQRAQTSCRWQLSEFLCLKLNSVSFSPQATIPTERPPLDGEVSTNFCGERERVSRGQRNGFPQPLISVF